MLTTPYVVLMSCCTTFAYVATPPARHSEWAIHSLPAVCGTHGVVVFPAGVHSTHCAWTVAGWCGHLYLSWIPGWEPTRRPPGRTIPRHAQSSGPSGPSSLFTEWWPLVAYGSEGVLAYLKAARPGHSTAHPHNQQAAAGPPRHQRVTVAPREWAFAVCPDHRLVDACAPPVPGPAGHHYMVAVRIVPSGVEIWRRSAYSADSADGEVQPRGRHVLRCDWMGAWPSRSTVELRTWGPPTLPLLWLVSVDHFWLGVLTRPLPRPPLANMCCRRGSINPTAITYIVGGHAPRAGRP